MRSFYPAIAIVASAIVGIATLNVAFKGNPSFDQRATYKTYHAPVAYEPVVQVSALTLPAPSKNTVPSSGAGGKEDEIVIIGEPDMSNFA